ncbi:MAG: hypothetical protein RIC06_17250 [Cyclobacteriaceae bacterium]
MKGILIFIFCNYILATSVSAQLSFNEFKMITHYHDEGSYVIHPVQAGSANAFDFVDGEGEKYILEAMIAGIYDVAHSSYQSSPNSNIRNLNRPRQWKFAIAGNVNFRLALSETLTSPSLPPSNKIGFRYDLGWSDSINAFGGRIGNRRINNFRLDLFHYSNGMAGLDSINERLSLRNSDFSTNYIRLSFGSTALKQGPNDTTTFTQQAVQAHSYSSLVAYIQYDEGIGGTLSYLPNDGNYGHLRIGGSIHYPIYISGLWWNPSAPPLFSIDLDMETVVDSIDDTRISRYGLTTKIVWHPYRLPSGVMVFYHFGRDYMNIRYTIPGNISIWGIGLSLQNL